MVTEGVKRKLAAILAADVAGYSRLMGVDEEGTLAELKRQREQLIDPGIAAHDGRLVKTTGDGLLVEFPSVVEALRFAVDMQSALARHNAHRPEERRIEFRIGINLGDVIVEGDDIYGDGVNVAARLEGLAEPGGICVSRAARDQVRDKFDFQFQDLGEQRVKNIARPVRVFRVATEPAAETPSQAAGRAWMWPAVGALALLAAAVVAVAWLRPWAPQLEVASEANMAFPLPQKPSIAVLAFENLSGDPKQEYFADGISENIITNLSKVSGLFVIARNSTFTYKGKPVKVQRVAEELGVRYVLEGSVQRAGDRVRITAQLIDAITGNHLWAERFDRDLQDFFALQDEIALQVVTALQVELTEGDQARIWKRGTNDLEAWSYSMRAVSHLMRFTKQDSALARQLWLQAVERDPNYAISWNGVAWTHWFDATFGWSDDPAESYGKSLELAQKALAKDDALPDAYSLLGSIYLSGQQHDQAIAHGEKAVALAPNHSLSTALLAYTLAYSGRPEDAKTLIGRAMRLSPAYEPWYLLVLGLAHRLMGQYEEGLAAYEKWMELTPDSYLVYLGPAIVYAHLGREQEARAALAKARQINPGLSAEGYARVAPFKDPAVLERDLAALRAAGLPD